MNLLDQLITDTEGMTSSQLRQYFAARPELLSLDEVANLQDLLLSMRTQEERSGQSVKSVRELGAVLGGEDLVRAAFRHCTEGNTRARTPSAIRKRSCNLC